VVLVDTSVWIGHFRQNEPALAALLNDGAVFMHPAVLGELACGNLKNRKVVLDALSKLPAAVTASDKAALHLIGDQKLWGRGIGWIDMHLLASALLSECALWTLDKELSRAGVDVGLKRSTFLT